MRKHLNIGSIRLGFATNSSSTHSILYKCDERYKPEHVPNQFGWEYFHLNTPEAKARYFATQVFEALAQDRIPASYRAAIVSQLTGVPMEDSGDEYHGYGYVDHQSHWTFPVYHGEGRGYNGNNGLHKEFLQALQKFIVENDDISIGGGNDNDSEDWDAPKVLSALPQEDNSKNWYCRQDGEWFTLFNTRTGAKIRVSFNPNAEPYVASKYPELVDIKITNYCSYGCKFCAPPGTTISSPEGDKPIEKVSVGDVVYAEDNGHRMEVVVEQTFERDYDGDMIVIEAEDGTILRLTPEHEVYTSNRGWIVAGDIQEDDEIVKM